MRCINKLVHSIFGRYSDPNKNFTAEMNKFNFIFLENKDELHCETNNLNTIYESYGRKFSESIQRSEKIFYKAD